MKRLFAIAVACALTSTLGCSNDVPGAPAALQGNALTASIDVPLLADTRMEESSPDSNYATVNVWGNGTTGRSTRSLLRFDVARIPAGVTITSARLKLTIANGTVHPYDFFEALRPWTETGATWNRYDGVNAWATAGADGAADRGTVTLASFASAPIGSLSVPLTAAGLDALRRWQSNPSSNQGFVFRGASSASTDDVKIENRDSATPPMLEVTYDTTTRSPYGGGAHAVPGRIEAEHFDVGGKNQSYFDDSAGNAGSWSTRNPTDVDIEPTSDTGGGANVGWFHANEWLEYTITSSVAATYLVEARVASPYAGKTVRFRVNADAWTGDIAVPATGAWQNWATTAATPIAVPAGTSVLRVSTGTGGFNLNFIDLRASGSTQPSTTTPSRIKVITWNLQQSSNTSAQADYLAQQSPDVIFCQETYASYASAIAARLGGTWGHHFFASASSEGVAVFTRRPILEREGFVIGPSSWGGDREAVRVAIDVDGKRVNVFSTHFDWPQDGVWGETSAHAIGRNAFLAWVGGFSGHKVFGGDFNARTNGNATQQKTIAEADLRGIDSCVSMGLTHDQCNVQYPTHGSRIDYIYRSSGLRTVSHRVLPSNGLSDHDMVISEMDVP
jgi:endonuclease/exonuclease/phosphatase family metal-dependent hydrolase